MNFHQWLTALTLSEVLDVALSYLKVILTWPTVVLLALLIFRKQIAGLISRVKSLAPTKVSFFDVRDTAADAEAAAAAATNQLQRASTSGAGEADADSEDAGRDVQPPPPHAPEVGAGAVAETDGSPRPYRGQDAAAKGTWQRLYRLLADDTAAVRPLSWGSRESSKAAVARVNDSWLRLEKTCRDAARSLGLWDLQAGSETRRPKWGPVELLEALYVEGRGSREAVRAAVRAQRLRAELNHGVAVDDDEAQALEVAIEDLASTVRKLAAMANGERIVKSYLKLAGHETLPKVDKPE